MSNAKISNVGINCFIELRLRLNFGPIALYCRLVNKSEIGIIIEIEELTYRSLYAKDPHFVEKYTKLKDYYYHLFIENHYITHINACIDPVGLHYSTDRYLNARNQINTRIRSSDEIIKDLEYQYEQESKNSSKDDTILLLLRNRIG